MNDIFLKQKKYFDTNVTRNYLFRMQMLHKLKSAIIRFQSQISDAIRKDLNKSESEIIITEIWVVLKEIRHHLSHLKQWMKPHKAKTSPLSRMGKGYLVHTPLGVNLIISPWTSPFELTFLPLIGSISAGDTAIIKPSENAPNTGSVIQNLIKETFAEEYISVIIGGREVTDQLLDLDFDHIFFTGSTGSGKSVMDKASKHLTKVTLELGGKNPCIIDETASIRLTCARIAYGKGINAGQTCTAPDYIICHERIFDSVVHYLSQSFRKFYGTTPLANDDFPKIVNERHFIRLLKFLQNAEIVFGGGSDKNRLKIEPTLIKVNNLNNPVVQEEILGPILPIITYQTPNDIDKIIAKNPNPLIVYIFSNNRSKIQEYMETISFGTLVINNTFASFTKRFLPFGGIRQSGMGHYYGIDSFNTFSQLKSIYYQGKKEFCLKYPPYSDRKKRLIRKMIK